MEALVILLFIILIVLLLVLRSGIFERMDRLEDEIMRLRQTLPPPGAKEEAGRGVPPVSAPVAVAPVAPEPVRPVAPEPVSPPEPVETAPYKSVPRPIAQLKHVASAERVNSAGQAGVVGPAEAFAAAGRGGPEETFAPAGRGGEAGRGEQDLEKFIGENLISKIGIAILVLTIGFFVKYAIDNDWIDPIGRVGIGVLCGGILIGLAHWLRKSYAAFSSVLVGGGLAVLYFTIALAYHQYQLI